MKKIVLPVLGIAAFVGLIGCQSAPQQDLESAQVALNRADSVEADIYASDFYAAALDSFAAATAEIEMQDANSAFSRNYDAASHLLAVTIESAQEAEAAAVQNKATVQAEADSLIALAQQALTASPEVMTQTGSENVSTLVNDAVAAQGLGDYMTARDLAQQAVNQLTQPASTQAAPRS